MLQHVLNVMFFAVVPLVLAGIGAHLATEELPEGSTKRRNIVVGVWLLALVGILCGILTEELNAKADRKREAEASDLNAKVDSVGRQNEQLLTSLLGNHTLSEADRRRKIEDALRSDYILHHDPIDPLILAGQRYPPAEWMNQRLKEMGESWNIVEAPTNVVAVKSPRTYIAVDRTPIYPGATSPISQAEINTGSQIFLNIRYKVTGPNEISLLWNYGEVMLLSDDEGATERKAASDFADHIKRRYAHFSDTPTTLSPESQSFFSAYPLPGESSQPQYFTQDQIDNLHAGKLFLLVFYEVAYKDNGVLHHERGCQFLQSPASTINGIWHSCNTFDISD